MADILQTTLLDAVSGMKTFDRKYGLNCVPWGLIDNKSALIQVMAFRLTSNKALSEPVII